MASSGLTSSFSFKPVLCRRGRAMCPLFLESEFTGIRVSSVNLPRIDSGVCVSVASVTAITARMGGGRYRPSSSSSDDEDGALDVSSIRSPSVRLIDAEQNMVGIVPKIEAIQMADEAELDLVILSPDADPPVVRIMDYRKYRYDLQKKKREQQKKTNRVDVKELKMGYNIDQHDYSVRLKAAQKFLKDGDKVKVIVNLKGRENEFRNIAIALLRRFQEEIGELATEESKNFRERNIFIILAPNKAVLQKAQDQPKKRVENAFTATRPGSGIVIAVKRLNQEGFQGHKEWLAEVNYLGQLSHPNLVRLIGYCLEDEHRLLVYEFMPRGSLENHLFRRGSHVQSLAWNFRMKVALGAAKGLAFLHSAETKVIYRDFKTSNILLDSEYNAKLSDFGLARDGPTGDKSHVSTRVMGTYGYAAPEYLATGHLTARSDVYSFGVVLLELLSGRRAIDKNRPPGEHNLVEWAKPYLNSKRRIFNILDARIEGQYSISTAQKVANLALQCLSAEAKFRPTMAEVVTALEQLQGSKESTKDVRNSERRSHSNTVPRHRKRNTHEVSNGKAASYPRPSASPLYE